MKEHYENISNYIIVSLVFLCWLFLGFDILKFCIKTIIEYPELDLLLSAAIVGMVVVITIYIGSVFWFIDIIKDISKNGVGEE